jgi:hypothetical protein
MPEPLLYATPAQSRSRKLILIIVSAVLLSGIVSAALLIFRAHVARAQAAAMVKAQRIANLKGKIRDEHQLITILESALRRTDQDDEQDRAAGIVRDETTLRSRAQKRAARQSALEEWKARLPQTEAELQRLTSP